MGEGVGERGRGKCGKELGEVGGEGGGVGVGVGRGGGGVCECVGELR